MKTIVLDGHRVVAAGDYVLLFPDHGIINPGPEDEAGNIHEGERLLYINDSMVLAEAVEVPSPFVSGAYTYEDGTFTLHEDSPEWQSHLENVRQELAAKVPKEVSRMRALKALFLAGVTESMVETEIAKMPSPEKELALIEFRTAQTFERHRPLVLQMGQIFGLDLDALFHAAAAFP